MGGTVRTGWGLVHAGPTPRCLAKFLSHARRTGAGRRRLATLPTTANSTRDNAARSHRAWKRPCLIRTASVQLAGSSKLLERNAATLETLLAFGSGGTVRSFSDLQIEHNPATVRFQGPVRVRLRGAVTDYSQHTGESALAESDLAALEGIDFAAPRCVTVENATKFHELCRLRSGDIFVFTSYPSKATVEFLRRIPKAIPLYHFGDTDPWGFDVLRTLRQSLDRIVVPLHMNFRPRAGAPPLQPRDRRKLATLMTNPLLTDVRQELDRLKAAKTKGVLSRNP